jgi:hypothetical protein
MTVHDIFTNTINASADGIDLATGDSLFVAQGVELAGEANFDGVFSNGNGISIDIAGAVFGGDNGIALSGNTNIVLIGKEGSITAQAGVGVEIGGSSGITNNGEIDAGTDGISATGGSNFIINNSNATVASSTGQAIFVSGGGNQVTNSGTLSADSNSIAAVWLYDNGADGGNALMNSGQISGGYGVFVSGTAGFADIIANSGTIQAPHDGIEEAGSGTLNITNSGTIDAATGIVFNGANDQLINSGTIEASASAVTESAAAFMNVTNEAGATIAGVAGGIQFNAPVATTDFLSNDGAIYSNSSTAVLESGAGNLTVTNGADGAVHGRYGMVFVTAAAGADTLDNAGAVTGVVQAVEVTSGASLAVNNGGTISGGTGIAFDASGGNTDTLDNTGTIRSTVAGGYAIKELGVGNLDVINGANGTIAGAQGAIVFNASSGSDSLDNSGVIASGNGEAVSQNGVASLLVNNSGTITGGLGVVFDGSSGTDTLENSGIIRSLFAGGFAVVESGTANLDITNSGHIVGNIALGNGTNIYDGTLGSVTGQVSGGNGSDALTGGAGSDHFFGGGGTGIDVLDGMGGNDVLVDNSSNATIDGGDGNDTINMSAAFNASDRIDGGTGRDTLSLNGDYSAGVTFAATTLTNVETITLGNGFKYALTTDDATVAAGQTLTVDGSALTGSNTLSFNGTAETDGRFVLTGGASNDVLTGGAGNDVLTGNAGNNLFTGGMGADHIVSAGGHDHFIYNDASESTGLAHDVITGFNALEGKFDLDVTVTGINSEVVSGRLSTGNFDANLTTAIGSAQLAAGHAVLFTPTVGNLAGHTFLIVDANGVAGYQAGQDYVFDLAGATHLTSLATTDFI